MLIFLSNVYIISYINAQINIVHLLPHYQFLTLEPQLFVVVCVPLATFTHEGQGRTVLFKALSHNQPLHPALSRFQ